MTRSWPSSASPRCTRTTRSAPAERPSRCARPYRELGLQARIGLNTGEVVTGTEERLATGDAVNVAARLEQAAQPAEILIGDGTLALVRDAVETEPVEPLQLKGKAGRSPPSGSTPSARRPSGGTALAASAGSASWRRCIKPGSARKTRSAASSSPSLGTPGSGSRAWSPSSSLLATRVSSTAAASPTARDHLLAGGRGAEAACDPSRRSRRGRLASLAARGDAGGDLGRRDRLGVPQAARGAGAARVRLRRHPVGRGDLPRPARARRRPALAEHRSCSSAWPGRSCSSTAPGRWIERDFVLEPLPRRRKSIADPRDRLRRARRQDPPRGRRQPPVRRGDGGDAARGGRTARWPSRPTIQALLAARLDQLEQPERAVLERGAVEGELFHRGAVQALASDEPGGHAARPPSSARSSCAPTRRSLPVTMPSASVTF